MMRDRSVELIARAFCVLHGHDPNGLVVDVRDAKQGPLGSIDASKLKRAWQMYGELAEPIVRALLPRDVNVAAGTPMPSSTRPRAGSA